jgi:hypothetical protein
MVVDNEGVEWQWRCLICNDPRKNNSFTQGLQTTRNILHFQLAVAGLLGESRQVVCFSQTFVS